MDMDIFITLQHVDPMAPKYYIQELWVIWFLLQKAGCA